MTWSQILMLILAWVCAVLALVAAVLHSAWGFTMILVVTAVVIFKIYEAGLPESHR